VRRWTSHSAAETRELGARLAAELKPNGVLLLFGDLGVGKTVLAQGVATALGLDPKQVQSPSYTLMVRHDAGSVRLTHIDLYRLEPEETYALGLEEELAAEGVKVVEWADRLPVAPAGAMELTMRRTEHEGEREILESGTE
jgi:tRNA threonylcarbamoyladenosine biosynthesis protein TsaE